MSALLTAVLLGSAVACTGGDSDPDDPASPPGSGASSAPRSAPLDVRVTRVKGRLPNKDRRRLAQNVGRVFARYLDDAFIGGDYPREQFGDAFATFSRGAARRAAADKELLTNAALGGSTVWVRAARRSAYLSVLAPNKVAAGLTARIEVTLKVDRGDKRTQWVHLSGRLLMARDKAGRWQIFGYDVARSVRGSRKGGSR